MAILGCLFVFILCCVGSNVFADYWIGKKTNLTDEKPKEEVSQLDEQLKEISEPIKTTKKHFESRIIEVSFKDKESEYFPQIKKENSSGRIDCFSPKDGWYYVGKEGFMDRLEARANDYKCACSTIKEAIEKINKYEYQCAEDHRKNMEYIDADIRRKASVLETKIIENY